MMARVRPSEVNRGKLTERSLTQYGSLGNLLHPKHAYFHQVQKVGKTNVRNRTSSIDVSLRDPATL